MKFQLKHSLPFIDVTLSHQGKSILLKNILIDTGSAGTCFNADDVIDIGIKLMPDCSLRHISGVGGTEWVFETTLDKIIVGSSSLKQFTIEVGEMNYGFGISGIIGTDYFSRAKLTIDFKKMTVY